MGPNIFGCTIILVSWLEIMVESGNQLTELIKGAYVSLFGWSVLLKSYKKVEQKIKHATPGLLIDFLKYPCCWPDWIGLYPCCK